MTTGLPASTTAQPRRRPGLAMLLAAGAAIIGLAAIPALSASASPAPAKPTAVAQGSTQIVNGVYTVHFDWGCTGSFHQALITFSPNGTFTSPPYSGEWVQQDGTLLFYFRQPGYAKYAGTVNGPVGSGLSTEGGGFNGCWYLTAQGVTGGALHTAHLGHAPDVNGNTR